MIEVYYFILGLILIVIGSLASARHPRKWRTSSNILYVAGMVLILFAIFALNDPIEGIPPEISNLISYLVVAGTFYGFLYKIQRDIRTDFEDKLRDFKSDIHRDIDRIERILEKKK